MCRAAAGYSSATPLKGLVVGNPTSATGRGGEGWWRAPEKQLSLPPRPHAALPAAAAAPRPAAAALRPAAAATAAVATHDQKATCRKANAMNSHTFKRIFLDM